MMCPAENPTSDSLKARAAAVLIVENEVLIRLSIAEFLRDNELHVIEASSPAEARSVMLAEVPIDVVFADANLPDEDAALPLAQWVGKNFPQVRVMQTAWPGAHPVSALPANVSAFVEKPYVPERVLQHIRDILAQRQD